MVTYMDQICSAWVAQDWTVKVAPWQMQLISTIHRILVWLKMVMKSADFEDMLAIQKRVTVVLWSILKEDFVADFQELYEHFQKSVVLEGDYFEAQ